MSFVVPQHVFLPPSLFFFIPTHQRQWVHRQQHSAAGWLRPRLMSFEAPQHLFVPFFPPVLHSHPPAAAGSSSAAALAAGSHQCSCRLMRLNTYPPLLPTFSSPPPTSGSGFIVSSVQRLVLTNVHVVDGAARVTISHPSLPPHLSLPSCQLLLPGGRCFVTGTSAGLAVLLLLPDSRRFATQSTALHPSADLAVLKIVLLSVTSRLHTKGPPASPLSSLQGVEEPAVARVKSELAVARVKSELAVARVKSELAVARVKSELAVARVKSELAVAEEEGTGWSAADSVGSAKERVTVHGCRGGGSREGVGERLIKGEWDENSFVAVIFGEARGGEQERGGESGGKGDGEEGERQGNGGERGGGQRDGREEGAGNREEEWLPCAPIGDSDDMELADWVILVGNPVGLPGSISLGVISSLHRTAAQVGVPHSSLHFFQIDCAINPGSSGSPLVNEFKRCECCSRAALMLNKKVGVCPLRSDRYRAAFL
ncbi:unnamed protein product [Closterium sp. NIES-65]|nr:unnamed protein product [Closterium sp. NIES-65]